MLASMKVEGVQALQKQLNSIPERLGINAVRATTGQAGREVVKAARSELGKEGPMPEMEKTWASIGVKRLKPLSGSYTVVVHVRNTLKYWGKLTAAGRAGLTSRGNYKTPGRKGRGDVTQHAQGDFIQAGFDQKKNMIKAMFSTWFDRQLKKRL